MISKTFVTHRFSKLDVAVSLGRTFGHPEGMAVVDHRVEVGEDPTDFEVVMTYEVLDSTVIVDPS